jgi:hypothetical protein
MSRAVFKSVSVSVFMSVFMSVSICKFSYSFCQLLFLEWSTDNFQCLNYCICSEVSTFNTYLFDRKISG